MTPKAAPKKRFLERIDRPEKNWKFESADVKEREYWDDYMKAYEDMIRNTATKGSPWYVVPADNKWFARLAVSEAICAVMERLNLSFPKVNKERQAELIEIKQALEKE